VISTLSLRGRLIAAFIAIVVTALLPAAVFGVVRFDAMVSEQAQNTATTSMRTASGLLSDQVTTVSGAVGESAGDATLLGADMSMPSYSADLASRADVAGLTYLAVLTPSGTVLSSNLTSARLEISWDKLVEWAANGTATSGLAVIPQTDVRTLGLADDLQLDVKETPNGTVVPDEEQGALCILATSPMGGNTLVGLRVLKLDYELVDSVVAKLGGTATVFQGGVRVSTTVKDGTGERAVGTVVSDTVRAEVLDNGRPFTGQAFVVDREYLASYEPLRDIEGNVIGMLYAGVDKTPFTAATRSFALTFGGVVVVALALALVGAFTVSRALTSPITTIGDAAARVATGDLTTRVPAQGYREARDLAESFNTMTSGLKAIIAQVDGSVHQLRAVSGEITAASSSSSEQANRQASAVAQTTATLEEMSRSFQSVSDGARRVLQVAEDALESAQDGVTTVDRAHDAMDELAAGARDLSTAAVAMDAVASEITEMTTIITGIAGQTKILALNAAIEAARAGEAGKGFAVVSSEIRSLADNVAQSAARIVDMVSGIQDASSRFQQAAIRQSTLSDSTLASRRESRQTFGLIVQQMEDTALAAREIAEAIVQQTRASDQLVQAMHLVSISSTETAAASRQLTDSAHSVESEAEMLVQGLTRFRTR